MLLSRMRSSIPPIRNGCSPGDYCLNSFPVSLPPGPENAQCVFAMLSSSVFLLSCMVITILILLVFTVLYLPLKIKTSDFELKLVK